MEGERRGWEGWEREDRVGEVGDTGLGGGEGGGGGGRLFRLKFSVGNESPCLQFGAGGDLLLVFSVAHLRFSYPARPGEWGDICTVPRCYSAIPSSSWKHQFAQDH